MSERMPFDDAGNPVQVLCPVTPKTVDAAVGSANRVATSGIVLVTATVDICYLLGDNAVAATTTSHFLPALTPLPIDMKSYTHISAIAFGATAGKLFISELE